VKSFERAKLSRDDERPLRGLSNHAQRAARPERPGAFEE
jgi:hypothetical protein